MSGNFGYGQQFPNDGSDDFNKTAFLVRQMMGRMETMKLVQVVAVHGNGETGRPGTVDVLPLVNQIDGSGNAQKHGNVYGIPWSRTQGGKNAVICDPVAGDIGYVVVSDRDISAVKASGKQSNPGSFRRYNIADGVYAGGCLNVAPEQYLVFTATGARLVDKTGNVVSMDATGIVLTPKAGLPVTINGDLIVTKTATVMQNLQLGGAIQSQVGAVYAGDLKFGGEVYSHFGTAGQVGLGTHSHEQGPDSHGDTEEPTNAPTPGT